MTVLHVFCDFVIVLNSLYHLCCLVFSSVSIIEVPFLFV